MTLSVDPYKGTRDFYPKDMQFRNWMFGKLAQTVKSFGFMEYGGPMLEPFELYAAKTGEEIVNQQLYWLMDKGDRKLAVRPEMTPTMARMVAAKINDLPRPIRLFSIPNLWRYERPQRGRLREHWQLNVDILGGDPLFAETEILTLAVELIRSFNGSGKMQVKVNHRKLMDDFFSKEMGFTADQTHKVVKAIDAKNKVAPEKFQSWLAEAGVKPEQFSRLDAFFQSSLNDLVKTLPGEGVSHLAALFQMLKDSGVDAELVFDPTVMRGLDYYTGTVFEIYDISPENHRAMFGGGRYDNLMGIFGKESLSGVGFGMGDVSLQNFLETHKLVPEFESEIDVMITLPKAEYRGVAEELARNFRKDGMRVMTPLGVSTFGNHLKLANRHQAKFAVLFGDSEMTENKVILKELKSGEQTTVGISDAHSFLKKTLSS